MVVCINHTLDQSSKVPPAALVLWDFDRYLAERLERGGLTEAEAQELERARERLHRLVNDLHREEIAA